jgi:CIC family chloride channel protein
MRSSGWSTITREQLNLLVQEGKGKLTLGSALPPQTVPSLYPDLPLDSALRYVHNYALVPVVNRANFLKLEGVISSESVFLKYGGAPQAGLSIPK